MNDCIGRLLFLFLVLEPYLAAAVTGADRSDTSFGSSDFVVVRVRDSTVVRCLRLPREDLASCPVWTHYPPSYHRFSDTERELNSCDEAYDDRFTLQTNTTVSILSITSIKPEDAGRYECQDDDDQLGFSKEIIVIGDNPKCSSRTHEDSHEKVGNFETRQTQSKLELHCEVGYSGSLNATGQCIVEWRIVGREDVLDSKCIVGDSSVKSTLTLDAVSHSNATSYVCVVRGSAVEQYEQYSCQTGQIDTPLTTHEDVASLSTDLQVSTVSHLPVGQSTEPETVDDRTSVSDHLTQPPSTKQFEVVRPQVHDIPQQMSEIVQVQKELLVIEKERLGLEREKIAMIATMVASHSDEVKKEI